MSETNVLMHQNEMFSKSEQMSTSYPRTRRFTNFEERNKEQEYIFKYFVLVIWFQIMSWEGLCNFCFHLSQVLTVDLWSSQALGAGQDHQQQQTLVHKSGHSVGDHAGGQDSLSPPKYSIKISIHFSSHYLWLSNLLQLLAQHCVLDVALAPCRNVKV